MREGGFYTWDESDIAAFETTHPVGTRARLALSLLLCTAQRRGDVIRIGRQHIKDAVLTTRQQKTGVLVEIPVLADLQSNIDASSKDHLTFLVTEGGKPFSGAGFGNWFQEHCNKAGLPKARRAHGLRKAAARRLAEAGCTGHEIMSITRHQTLKEVTRYTAAADRKHLAREATAKAEKRASIGKPG